jgi:membrane protease YdiL (CAAX protease family)
MEAFGLALTALGLALVGYTIYLANAASFDPARGPLLRALLAAITGAGALLGLLLMSSLLALPDSNAGVALFGAGVASAAALFNAAVLASGPFRSRLRPLLGERYNPASPVHATALVLSAALLSYTVVSLIAGGGVEGLAEAIEDGGVPAAETLFQNALWVIAALLGAGMFLRRTPAETMQRLGLRVPGVMDVALGIGMGFLLYGVVLASGLVWLTLTPAEQMAQQSAVSEALAASVTTLPQALLLSLPVAIGEEIFFRGALQPVLGLVPTSLFFTALHAQYGFTPALVSLFVVGLALGVLARRRGTVAAILAHFVFNFVQLALALLATSLLPAGGT